MGGFQPMKMVKQDPSGQKNDWLRKMILEIDCPWLKNRCKDTKSKGLSLRSKTGKLTKTAKYALKKPVILPISELCTTCC